MGKHPKPDLLDEGFQRASPAKSDSTKSPLSESSIDKAGEDNRLSLLRERLHSAAPGIENVKPKLWRVEVRDPRKSTRWRTLGEIDEDELGNAEQIRDTENKTNAPALIRIVRKTRF